MSENYFVHTQDLLDNDPNGNSLRRQVHKGVPMYTYNPMHIVYKARLEHNIRSSPYRNLRQKYT